MNPDIVGGIGLIVFALGVVIALSTWSVRIIERIYKGEAKTLREIIHVYKHER